MVWVVRCVGILEYAGVRNGAPRGGHEVKGLVGTKGGTAVFAEGAESGFTNESSEIWFGGFDGASGFR